MQTCKLHDRRMHVGQFEVGAVWFHGDGYVVNYFDGIIITVALVEFGVAKLNDDMISINQSTIKTISGLTDFREGSFVVYREPYYHFTYSIDDTGSENYRVGYATAESADGPWTYRGVVLQKDESQGILATGHDSMVNVPGTDDWYIA